MIGRAETWWADLGEPRGSSPGFRRPVLVVSADAYNRSRIATVTCVVITSNLRLADAPGNVSLAAGTGGLERGSVANVSQVVTIDKDDLVERFGRLDHTTMRAVDAGLLQALDLTSR